jgi:hypothetical protein
MDNETFEEQYRRIGRADYRMKKEHAKYKAALQEIIDIPLNDSHNAMFNIAFKALNEQEDE